MTTPALEARASNTVADWPLRFTHHNFQGACFDTQTCSIRYHDAEFGLEEPGPSKSSLSPEVYDQLLMAGYGPVALSMPSAQVNWRSKDGAALQAELDIAEIFKDHLIRHEVPREDIAEDASVGFTHIVLEVEDRTINLYTRTMIPTKREQTPGNPASSFRNDLFKVYTKTY